MEKFEIHIGKSYDLESRSEKPLNKIIITGEQFAIIEQFADTRRDEDLNIIYRINECEFKVMPHFDFQHTCTADNAKDVSAKYCDYCGKECAGESAHRCRS